MVSESCNDRRMIRRFSFFGGGEGEGGREEGHDRRLYWITESHQNYDKISVYLI